MAVARELVDYLSQISGAKFSVETGDGSRGIVLGTLADYPDASLNDALAIKNTYDGKEAFAIRTEKDRVRLIGATDLGASHAAVRRRRGSLGLIRPPVAPAGRNCGPRPSARGPPAPRKEGASVA